MKEEENLGLGREGAAMGLGNELAVERERVGESKVSHHTEFRE